VVQRLKEMVVGADSMILIGGFCLPFFGLLGALRNPRLSHSPSGPFLHAAGRMAAVWFVFPKPRKDDQ
jgi:hypothetical protein